MSERERWIQETMTYLREVGAIITEQHARIINDQLRDAMALADHTRETTCVAVPCPSCGANVLVKATDVANRNPVGGMIAGGHMAMQPVPCSNPSVREALEALKSELEAVDAGPDGTALASTWERLPDILTQQVEAALALPGPVVDEPVKCYEAYQDGFCRCQNRAQLGVDRIFLDAVIPSVKIGDTMRVTVWKMEG